MRARTRNTLITLVVLLVLILAVPVTIFVRAFGSNIPIPDGMELTPTARLIKDGFVDVTLLDLQNGTVGLIDAGNDPSGKAILAELHRRGLGPEAVSAILLTHGHQDHVAGCKLFPRADIYALEAEVPLIAGLTRPKGMLTRFMPIHPTGIRVSHSLTDGQTLALGNRLVQVFSVPGHTDGSAVYLIDGVLYFGDSATSHQGGVFAPAVALFSDSPSQNVAALKALAHRLAPIESTIKTLEFAHSGPLPGFKPFADWARQ